MSIPPSRASETASGAVELRNRIGELTVSGVRATAFWAAVALPLVYFPVLYGVVVPSSPDLFLSLLAVHVLCVVVGHGHKKRARE